MSEGNGDRPTLDRIAPAAAPLWFLTAGQSVDAELAIRTARLEGLRRFVDDVNEEGS